MICFLRPLVQLHVERGGHLEDLWGPIVEESASALEQQCPLALAKVFRGSEADGLLMLSFYFAFIRCIIAFIRCILFTSFVFQLHQVFKGGPFKIALSLPHSKCSLLLCTLSSMLASEVLSRLPCEDGASSRGDCFTFYHHHHLHSLHSPAPLNSPPWNNLKGWVCWISIFFSCNLGIVGFLSPSYEVDIC